VLDAEIGDKEQQVAKGQRAFQTLKVLRKRSLPADAEVARSQYKAWLLDLAEKEIKLDEPVVTPGSISRRGDAKYQRISLAVSGKGTLAQLTEFLYRFYATDFLHQIRSLDIQPIDDSRQLEMFLGVDALVIDGAEDSETLSPQPSALAHDKTLEQFSNAILGRNLFGPANRPPQLASIGSQKAYADESLSLALKATDPDPLDKISFQLAAGNPEGVSVDSSGKLRFRASKVGTYEITVEARDDGLPPLSVTKSFSVSVTERPKVVARADNRPPPKPKPYFEDAEFAFVTAITEVNGQRQLWLNIRTSGETLKLNEGDKFEVKRLQGVVTNIAANHIDVQAAGESRRFELGDNLAQGQLLLAPALDAAFEGSE
jgi:hypothetical protein